MMPNMTVMAPKNKWELSDMLKFAVAYDGPIAVRYPRGEAYTGLEEHRAPIKHGTFEIIEEESEIALLAVGSMVKEAERVRDILKEDGQKITLINARFVKPLDTKMLDKLAKTHKLIVTMEENVKTGGFGQQVMGYYNNRESVSVLPIAIDDTFVTHGNTDYLMKHVGLDAKSVAARIKEYRW